jgi:prepilin-type N-terminal cleavage/methylation domain-containing protein
MRRAGFTLIEVLVATTLSVGLIGLAGSAYIQSERLTVAQADELAVAQNARVLVDRISRDVRQTTEFIATLPDNAAEGVTVVEFVDGHEPPPGGPYYLRYELVDQEVWRRRQYYYRPSQPEVRVDYNPSETIYEEGAGAPDDALVRHLDESTLVADGVTDLAFWGSASLLRIDVWLAQGRSEIYQLHSAVAKRN